jgi:cell division protein FtsN
VAIAGLAAIAAVVWAGSRIEWRQDFRRMTAWVTRAATRPPQTAIGPPASPARPAAPKAAPSPPVPAPPAPARAGVAAAEGVKSETVKTEVLEAADGFAVLIASFKNRRNADDAVASLDKVGLSAFVRSDGVWNLVLVGPYVTTVEAADALDRVPHRRYPDAHIQRQSVQAMNR